MWQFPRLVLQEQIWHCVKCCLCKMTNNPGVRFLFLPCLPIFLLFLSNTLRFWWVLFLFLTNLNAVANISKEALDVFSLPICYISISVAWSACWQFFVHLRTVTQNRVAIIPSPLTLQLNIFAFMIEVWYKCTYTY